MHALSNYLRGPYVTRSACRAAATLVSANLSQSGDGDSEAYAHHLHSETGWLSIDVINVIGATLGIEVEGVASAAEDLRQFDEVDCLVNCNNSHWTVLQQHGSDGPWLHTDSIEGGDLFPGRVCIESLHRLYELLAGLRARYGGVLAL